MKICAQVSDHNLEAMIPKLGTNKKFSKKTRLDYRVLLTIVLVLAIYRILMTPTSTYYKSEMEWTISSKFKVF